MTSPPVAIRTKDAFSAGWSFAKKGRAITENPFRSEEAKQKFERGFEAYQRKLKEIRK